MTRQHDVRARLDIDRQNQASQLRGKAIPLLRRNRRAMKERVVDSVNPPERILRRLLCPTGR